MKHIRMVDDCIVLLAYVAKNPYEWQTVLGFENIGIPRGTLRHILQDAKERGPNSTLARVAANYGYGYKLMNKPGHVIDVVYRGPFKIRYDG